MAAADNILEEKNNVPLYLPPPTHIPQLPPTTTTPFNNTWLNTLTEIILVIRKKRNIMSKFLMCII